MLRKVRKSNQIKTYLGICKGGLLLTRISSKLFTSNSDEPNEWLE